VVAQYRSINLEKIQENIMAEANYLRKINN
jgi:hypothetical protein